MIQKTYTFHIHGMHCAACVLVTESELKSLPNVTDAQSNLHHRSVEITGDFGDKSPAVIAEELSVVLAKHGYKLSPEKPSDSPETNKWTDFKIAIPIAIGFAGLFVILQKIGLANMVNTSSISYGTALMIGIIASLSTCMAVVGGLVLSMSATLAKEGDRVRPQVLFHLGRIISFFVLGGVIGAIGSAFTLNPSAIFILNLVIGIIMIILGLNLLDVFHWAKKFQPAMPKFLSRHAIGFSKFNHSFTPFLVGVVTFFLPCGFTQSMQIYTLSAGNFIKGGLTMFAFALGTLPVLALISFSSTGIRRRSTSGVFFKSAGLIVIMFALFNFINGLVVVGLISPVFNF